MSTRCILSYFNPPTNRYRYQLEGLDRQWNEVGSDQRIATYTTLPAGIYKFRAQGATARGGWGEPGVALTIKISPPWWETWWFRSSLCLVLLAIMLCGYAARVRVIKNREVEFRKLADNAPDLVMRLDSELRYTYVNPVAAELEDTTAPMPEWCRDHEVMALIDGLTFTKEQKIAKGLLGLVRRA